VLPAKVLAAPPLSVDDDPWRIGVFGSGLPWENISINGDPGAEESTWALVRGTLVDSACKPSTGGARFAMDDVFT
jgi:hypothetical protein